MKLLSTCFIFLFALGPVYGESNGLPFIDAHSQFDEDVSPDHVMKYLARAGVTQVVLSTRGKVTPSAFLEMGAKYPDCIVPSVRIKGRAYDENQPGYYKQLNEQLAQRAFKAMSEIILAHAPKGDRAREVYLEAETPQVQAAVKHAIAKGWPLVLHYEFRWLTSAYGVQARAKRMEELRSLLSLYPQHPFALIHMAQLDANDAASLLAAHANVFFLTSHANPVKVSESSQPWTDMFVGDDLAPDWSALILRYPDRFVFAIDNVWPEDWSEKYVSQVGVWRQALGKLPEEVAHAVAHGNAERLWKLPSAKPNNGCAALKRAASP